MAATMQKKMDSKGFFRDSESGVYLIISIAEDLSQEDLRKMSDYLLAVREANETRNGTHG